MNREILTSSGNDSEEGKFLYSNHPTDIYKVDVDKVLISNMISSGKKRF